MSVIDSITKNYMQQNTVFADVFNFLIYDGRPVIEAKKLRELDTTELAVLYGQDVAAGKKRSEAVQKYRDGPLSLHEMMPELSAELAQYVQNYRIHLIDPSRLTKEELHKFTTSFREVMECIKCSKDKEQMKELLHDNPRMQMDASAARVISAVTSMELEIAEGAEVVDMCKAIDDMMSESRQEGICLGITEGEAKGIIETGCEFGISKEDILSRLQKKLNVSMEQAQEYFSIFGKQTV